MPKRREKQPKSAPSSVARVLPMLLRIGDRLTDETGNYEIIGRPYTTNAGKGVHARVKKVDQSNVTEIRTWGAHERLAIRRT